MADHVIQYDYPVRQSLTRFQQLWGSVTIGFSGAVLLFLMFKGTILPWVGRYIWPLFGNLL